MALGSHDTGAAALAALEEAAEESADSPPPPQATAPRSNAREVRWCLMAGVG